jgi:hypothetical protein
MIIKMKCVKWIVNDLKNPKIARLPDEEAVGWVSTGNWVYVPKHEYKAFINSTK